MSIWAAIKYAINSTLGTLNFEPLDKLIKNQKTLYATEDFYTRLYGAEVTIEVEELGHIEKNDIPISITMRGAGSFKLSYEVKGSSNARAKLIVIKNGEIITLDDINTPSSAYAEIYTSDCVYSDGDVFSFQYQASSRADGVQKIYFKNLNLNGKITENVFELKGV